VIDHQGNITLFSGKVEIGTGTQTAFSQIVAEELHTSISKITYVQGDTANSRPGFHGGQQIDPGTGPLPPTGGGDGVPGAGCRSAGTVTTNPSATIRIRARTQS